MLAGLAWGQRQTHTSSNTYGSYRSNTPRYNVEIVVTYRQATELCRSHVRARRVGRGLLQRHGVHLQASFAKSREASKALPSYQPRPRRRPRPLHSVKRRREHSSVLTKRHHIGRYWARKGSTWHRHWQGW